MIYFTIPASTGLVGEDWDVPIDREPQASSTLNLLSYGTPDNVLTQRAANGINIRDEAVTFTIKNLRAAEALIINEYFTGLKTANLTLVYEEGSKNYYIVGWNYTLKNSLYVDLVVSLELMYL